MPRLLWDASALVKRFVPEVGSDVVGRLFAVLPASHMAVSVLGYAETQARTYLKDDKLVGEVHF